MYEELIKELRDPVHSLDCEFCNRKCCYSGGNPDTKCFIIQAADAIEELQHTIRGMAAVGKFLLEVHELDCQYPTVRLRGMNEPLPKNPYDCLVIVRETPCCGGDNSLNYFPGFAKYDGEQWNDKAGTKVPFEVIYWMPLPKLPKEEA